jgi:hypothetical protein
MAELKFTISQLQIALGRFFGEVSYQKYCEMCGGQGDISEEEWEYYSKFNWLLYDKIHPPFLERMIEMHQRSLDVIKPNLKNPLCD